MKVQYNVNGLVNNQIKTQLKNVLDDLEGVINVNVDLAKSTVEVDCNKKANEDEIRNGIEHVGCRVESSSTM